MGIIFLNAGLNTTVQDMGRNGHQKSGFHVCGVMDRRSYRLANMLLDNDENAAVLEFTLMGPTIQFTSDTVIAITGGDFAPTLNEKPIAMYQAVSVKKDDVLRFGLSRNGNWGYLAFADGLDIPKEMGSCSTDVKCSIGGFKGRKLEKDDQIDFCTNGRYLKNFHYRKLRQPDFTADVAEIRVVMGPQDDYFTEEGIQTFLNSEYVLTSQSDRMGYRLEGDYIEHNEKGSDIISDGISFGSIQVPAHGKPIIMLADRQTTGGYTKIATVASVDIPKLVQCPFNKKVKFTAIDVEEAQKLYLAELDEYRILNHRMHQFCWHDFPSLQFSRKFCIMYK